MSVSADTSKDLFLNEEIEFDQLVKSLSDGFREKIMKVVEEQKEGSELPQIDEIIKALYKDERVGTFVQHLESVYPVEFRNTIDRIRGILINDIEAKELITDKVVRDLVDKNRENIEKVRNDNIALVKAAKLLFADRDGTINKIGAMPPVLLSLMRRLLDVNAGGRIESAINLEFRKLIKQAIKDRGVQFKQSSISEGATEIRIDIPYWQIKNLGGEQSFEKIINEIMEGLSLDVKYLKLHQQGGTDDDYWVTFNFEPKV
ncbi:MAG: hypothetical protein WC269_02020 [Candidatus Gracilibacteria bacterium]|jgi:hypothetical protein